MTGPSFTILDDETGMHHNDGAFSGLFLSRQAKSKLLFGQCQRHHSLNVPWTFDMQSNILNIFLSSERAKYFWNEGFANGVR